MSTKKDFGAGWIISHEYTSEQEALNRLYSARMEALRTAHIDAMMSAEVLPILITPRIASRMNLNEDGGFYKIHPAFVTSNVEPHPKKAKPYPEKKGRGGKIRKW